MTIKNEGRKGITALILVLLLLAVPAWAGNNSYPRTGAESDRELLSKHEKAINKIYDGPATVGSLTSSGTITTGNLVSTGTASFNVISQTTGTATVTNLNADMVDGSHAADLLNPTTQTDVTASRTFTTVYQNTSGKPMFVNVVAHSVSVATLSAYADGSNPPTTVVSQAYTQSRLTIPFIVLPNHYYKVTYGGTPTLDYWIEWD